MATMTFVLAEDTEAGDLINIYEFEGEVIESDILVPPTEPVRVLVDAEDVDKFNVRVSTFEGELIVARGTRFELFVQE